MAAEQHASLEITLLTGFLGAGKTTLLSRLLRNTDGARIGVIVNDVAALNVDLQLLEEAASSGGDGGNLNSDDGVQFASFANGCACCDGQAGLNESLTKLLNGQQLKHNIARLSGQQPPPPGAAQAAPLFDHIVIEASGVAEPKQLRLLLKDMTVKLSDGSRCRLRLVTSVCVLDVATFAEHYHSPLRVSSNRRLVVQLLCEQIEHSDAILLSKLDTIPKEEDRQGDGTGKGRPAHAQVDLIRALVKTMNASACIMACNHGVCTPFNDYCGAEPGLQRQEGQEAVKGTCGAGGAAVASHPTSLLGILNILRPSQPISEVFEAPKEKRKMPQSTAGASGAPALPSKSAKRSSSDAPPAPESPSDGTGSRLAITSAVFDAPPLLNALIAPPPALAGRYRSEYGICSFVYEPSRRVPFHPGRLMDSVVKVMPVKAQGTGEGGEGGGGEGCTPLIGDWLAQKGEASKGAGAADEALPAAPQLFSGLLRSKGWAWLATGSGSSETGGGGLDACGSTFYWEYAGQLFTLKEDKGRTMEAASAAAPDRRKALPQIVFIGLETHGFNEARIRSALDECLLTEDEISSFCPPSKD